MKNLKKILTIILLINIVIFIYLIFSKGVEVPTKEEYYSLMAEEKMPTLEGEVAE